MIVYIITNQVNGKQYVGQTIKTLETRWRRHCWASTAMPSRMPITKAIQKYGAENFKIETLCTCTSQEDLNIKEGYFARALNTFSPVGYNLTAGDGYGAMSDEMRKRISESRKGWVPSAVTRGRMSEAHKGLRYSEETRRRRSDRMRGKKMPVEALAALSEAISKRSYPLLSPTGQEVVVSNMAAFCREANLNGAKMSLVMSGGRLSHKGWKKNIKAEVWK